MSNPNMVTVTVLEGGEETPLTENKGFTVGQVRRKLNIPVNYTCVNGNGAQLTDSSPLNVDCTLEFVPPTKEKATGSKVRRATPKTAKAVKTGRKVVKTTKSRRQS